MVSKHTLTILNEFLTTHVSRRAWPVLFISRGLQQLANCPSGLRVHGHMPAVLVPCVFEPDGQGSLIHDVYYASSGRGASVLP